MNNGAGTLVSTAPSTFTPLPWTAEEIIARIQRSQFLSRRELFDFRPAVLGAYLTFDEARPLLIPEATAEQWEVRPRSREAVLQDMCEYITYAWGKVLDHRGLSTLRSVQRMEAWLWLLGDDELLAQIESAAIPYAPYGAPVLGAICGKYQWSVPGGPEAENMRAGRPCRPDCPEGCRR